MPRNGPETVPANGERFAEAIDAASIARRTVHAQGMGYHPRCSTTESASQITLASGRSHRVRAPFSASNITRINRCRQQEIGRSADEGGLRSRGSRLEPGGGSVVRAKIHLVARMSTTHPSASTGHRGAHAVPQCVQWVFPLSIAMPTRRRQIIGRDAECDTALPGTEISRKHAEFVLTGPVLAIHDLGSRNGVFVNGVRGTDLPLTAGDVIRCGEWVGVVVADAEAEGFREIWPGWYGGASLATAAEPARRLKNDLPVLIQGETGTGKEGMARAVHGWSGRLGPFVAVNCAAIPPHLAEAELFGYRKGAFTGADKSSPGLFRAAHGGTLFLDEVVELSSEVQPKLLRVLERSEVLALGETTPVGIDVRIVAATQEPLANAVSERRFRADLYARLDGLTIVLPPLRDRREDVVPLFQELLRQQGGGRAPPLEAKLAEALTVYDWPLNVRELVLLVRRLLATHDSGALRKGQLPGRMLSQLPKAPALPSEAGLPAAEGGRPARRKVDDAAEFEALVGALRAHGGSVARAAAAIGVSRARAYRLLAAHPDFSLEPTNES